jgi:hypothetical protein
MLPTCFHDYFPQPWRLTPILYVLNIPKQGSRRESSLIFITKAVTVTYEADQSRTNENHSIKDFVVKFVDHNKNTQDISLYSL